MAESKKSEKPQIIPLPNGPYYYFTRFEPKEIEGIANSKGEKPFNVPGVALCRCGGSKNKPFCDGTHWHIGFKDEKN
jgi:CDGSH-type Zn-finger protein